jgi:hypothetical protein
VEQELLDKEVMAGLALLAHNTLQEVEEEPLPWVEMARL